MKEKNGFTLSEVLIALGIIGVVSALTIPALLNSNKGDLLGSKLAVIASSIENAFSSCISNQNSSDIFGTKLFTSQTARYNSDESGEPTSDYTISGIDSSASDANIRSFVGELGKYMVINGYEKNARNLYPSSLPTNGFYNINASGKLDKTITTYDLDFNNYIALKLKNGAFVLIKTNQENGLKQAKEGETSKIVKESTAAKFGTALRARAGDIIIDVNGKDAPNTVGRDIFRFCLGQNGVLYPYGGYDEAFLTIFENNPNPSDSTNPPIWSSTSNSGTTAWYPCNGSAKGWGCTARLAENNYKFDY